MPRSGRGVPVDARIEKGRSPTHALRSGSGTRSTSTGSSRPRRTGGAEASRTKDVTWILTHAPSETIVLKPSPSGAVGVSGAD